MRSGVDSVNELNTQDTAVLAQVSELQQGPASQTQTSPITPAIGSGQFIVGSRASRASVIGQNLYAEYFETDTGLRYYWDGTKWLYSGGTGVGTDATRAALTIAADDDGAFWYTTDGGKWWHVEGGAWVDKTDTIDLISNVQVGGQQVVGPRGSAVADVGAANAVDLASVIILANETKLRLNTLLNRQRIGTGHGLIDA